MAFLKQIPSNVRKVAVVAATEIEIILRQNSARPRKVPENVIMRMYKTIQMPRKDEGWDSIIIESHPNNSKGLDDYLCAAKGIEHDNPHHSANIYEHMTLAADYVNNYSGEIELSISHKEIAYLAAKYHDIAKPIVKSRILWSGKEDDHSHYYNHAEVGAYLAACCNKGSYSENLFLDKIIILIQWHMATFERKDYMEKFEELYGSELTKCFALLHEADLAAH